MGREAVTQADIAGERREVKVVLEAGELLLRGAVRRRYARSALTKVRAEAGVLRFEGAGEAVALHLGEPQARRWAEAIQKPLPTLREKLDLKGLVLRIGPPDDAELAAALEGACIEDASVASMIVARIDDEADLATALAVPGALPIWAIYPKGKRAFGDAAIRAVLRAAGYRDSKSCAVSDRLTATRYHPPR